MIPRTIDPREKLAGFDERWSPRIVAQVNDSQVKLAKLEGEFVWHAHADEDELFLVLRGRLLMRFRDGETWIEEGEMLVVPRGVEHLPVAPEEVHVLLVEPASTRHTGDVVDPRTVDEQPWI